MKKRIICLLALILTTALVLRPSGQTMTQLPGVSSSDRELIRIWTVSAIGGGQAWLTKALRAYEKAHPGVMTYLRTVSAAELSEPDAVLPDLVLYMPGDVTDPSGFADLSGMFAMDEPLLRCGRWRGAQKGLPLCWGAYVLAVSASLDPAAATPAPTPILGRPAQTLAPEQTAAPGYPLEAANLAAEALQAPGGAALFTLALLPDVRPRLPQSFGTLTSAAVYARYAAGGCASAVLTTGQLVALEALASGGKASAFRVIVPDTVITDQVWLGSVVNGASPRAAEVLGYLADREAQRMLEAQGLHPALNGLRLYALGTPALVDRAAACSLTAINAFVPAADVAVSADQTFRGVTTLDEALLPLI